MTCRCRLTLAKLRNVGATGALLESGRSLERGQRLADRLSDRRLPAHLGHPPAHRERRFGSAPRPPDGGLAALPERPLGELAVGRAPGPLPLTVLPRSLRRLGPRDLDRHPP